MAAVEVKPTSGADPGGPEVRVAPQVRSRFEAIDLLRGAVMVLMALDHTRDFFSNAHVNPTDPAQTTTALFFTRWVTHFCAPVFVFLAGTGAFLYGSRGKTRPQLAWFLVSRGLWLVVLEFTLVRFGWSFRLQTSVLIGQVIWAIGGAMILLAGLVFLPAGVVAGLGLLLVAGHNALDYLPADGWRSLPGVVGLLRTGRVQLGEGLSLFVAYPVLPWLGVMALGYGIGPLWTLDRPRRRRWLVRLGVAATVLFVVLRGLDGYGDPSPWSPQRDGWFTFLSFLNCTKYPPSLLYVLMTLGPALLALAWFDRSPGPLGRALVTFGRVPLFYYLLHLPVIHGLAVGLALVRYGRTDSLLNPFSPGQRPADYGYGLPVVYLLWLVVVVLLYPPCRWFAEVKRRRREGWLSYL
jgi:uncharacterized membrane protein